MHLSENRIATILVESENELKTDGGIHLFGWAVGEAVGPRCQQLWVQAPTCQLVK